MAWYLFEEVDEAAGRMLERGYGNRFYPDADLPDDCDEKWAYLRAWAFREMVGERAVGYIVHFDQISAVPLAMLITSLSELRLSFIIAGKRKESE